MRRLNSLLYYNKVGVHTSYWKKKLFPKNLIIKIIIDNEIN